MTKEEFKVLVMIYVANVDGHIHENEVEQMLEKTDSATLERIKKDFRKMSDMDILSCIQENKRKFIVDEASKQGFLDEIQSVIVADDHCSPMETHLMRTLKKMLG